MGLGPLGPTSYDEITGQMDGFPSPQMFYKYPLLLGDICRLCRGGISLKYHENSMEWEQGPYCKYCVKYIWSHS